MCRPGEGEVDEQNDDIDQKEDGHYGDNAGGMRQEICREWMFDSRSMRQGYPATLTLAECCTRPSVKSEPTRQQHLTIFSRRWRERNYN